MADSVAALLEEIHEEITCGICLEIYTTPKVLPCQHIFCQDCLQQAAETGEMFTCPICDEETNITPGGVKDLPEDKTILNLCDRIHNQALLPLLETEEDEEEKPKPNTHCETHPSEKLTLYCVECKEPVCTVCLDETHAEHRMMTFRKALQDRKDTVSEYIERGKDLLESHCGIIKGLRIAENALQEQKQQVTRSICDTYEKMMERLMEMKEGMLREVEEKHRQNMEAVLNAKKPALDQLCTLSITCNGVDQTLEQRRAEFTRQEETLFQVVGDIRENPDMSCLQTPELVPLNPEMPQSLQYDSLFWYRSLTVTPSVGHVTQARIDK